MAHPPPTPTMVIEEVDAIIRNVREHANVMNRRWGFNRLPHLVGIDLLQRFISQKRKWEAAVFDCCGSAAIADLERVRKQGAAMQRAYAALEAEALERGQTPTPPGVWEFELVDGTPIVLVRTREELANVERNPGAQVWALEEIAAIIAKYPALALAKEHFPEAELIRIAPSDEVRELVDDCLSDIPFGG